MWQVSTTLRGWLVQGMGGCWTLNELPPDIAALLDEIRRALDAELYYVAIAVALSIPDICACLECDPQKIWSTEAKYKSWFDENVASRFVNLISADCYRLRCGVLHQGKFGHPKSRYDRVVFLAPNPSLRLSKDVLVTIASGVEFADVKGKVLQIEAVWFCEQFIEAARQWAVANSENVNVRINMPNLVRFRSNGLPPYIIGIPLIA